MGPAAWGLGCNLRYNFDAHTSDHYIKNTGSCFWRVVVGDTVRTVGPIYSSYLYSSREELGKIVHPLARPPVRLFLFFFFKVGVAACDVAACTPTLPGHPRVLRATPELPCAVPDGVASGAEVGQHPR